MGEDALVDIQVTGAIELLRKLDDTGHGPSLAAWYYYDDANEWRLLMYVFSPPALEFSGSTLQT